MHYIPTHYFRISAIVESGLMQKWQKKYWLKDKCDKSFSSIGYIQISLQNTTGAFIALAVGITASIVTFTIEVLGKMLQDALHSRYNHNRFCKH